MTAAVLRRSAKILLRGFSRDFCAPKMAEITKIDAGRFAKILTPELNALVDIFRRHDFEIRIAGGAVRDILIAGDENALPDDIDFATTATPAQMKEMFAKEGVRTIKDQGEKHGTITARINDKVNFEVTTLRIDKVTDGRHAEVEFTQNWQLDAERRDLTVNSMFLDIDGTLHDYFGGHDDLKKRHVAFVGNAEARIQEDYLRIMRYFRFYGRLAAGSGGSHGQETLEAIRRNAAGLGRISGERIWTEWRKILVGPEGGQLTLTMIDLGLGPHMGLPESVDRAEMGRVSRLSLQSPPEQFSHVTLLSSLLRSEEDVMGLFRRVKMSAFERDLGLFVVRHRANPYDLGGWKRLLARSRKQKPADVRAWIVQSMLYRGQFDLVGPFSGWEMPEFPVTGRDLREAGLSPGKLMGRCLESLRQAWAAADFQLSKDHLVNVELPKLLDEVAKKASC